MLWFDLLEKEDMLRRPGAEKIDIGDPVEGARLNEMENGRCPRCNDVMIRMVDKDQFHIEFESCPSCYGTFFDAGEFWQTAVRNASAYCEMTAALHDILNVIPAIANRNHRKAAARSFKGRCKIRLGKTLSEALESLLNAGDQVPLGATHPAKRSLATGEAVEDAEEPNEKRTKVESAEGKGP